MTLLLSFLLSWQVFFSPNGGTQTAIIRNIDSAKTQILVQAYSFTNEPIARALVKAKERGCEVRIILDKGQLKDKHSRYQYCIDRNIPIKFDRTVKIQHNKVMIIDSIVTITGSYNFTKAGEHRNAENTLILKDKALASEYLRNWHVCNTRSTE